MGILGQISDFFIKIIIMFTALLALIHFAGAYPKYAFTFSLLGLILLISILVKGIVNMIESRKE